MKISTPLCFLFGLLLVTSCKKELEPQQSSIATNPTTATTTAPATTAAQPQTATIATPTQNTATAPGMNPAHGQPGHRCDIAVGAPLNGTTAPQNTTTQNGTPVTQQMKVTVPPLTPQNAGMAKGMNPAHGQPGHRCDITVGAPLNSVPNKPVVQPQATTQEVTAPTAPTTTVVTAAGMNPPHGQAGHVCGIAVGAPLPKT